MITSYKNMVKINSVSTGNNCFCNIWKDVNFAKVWPHYNFKFVMDINSCVFFLWQQCCDLGQQVI